MYVYSLLFSSSHFFFIPLFLKDYVLLDHFIYMYILNKSFISKEYSAVVERIEGSFLDGASLISQLENEMFIEVGGRGGGERREKRSLNISLA